MVDSSRRTTVHTAAYLTDAEATALRTRLLDQMAYLCDEVAALKPIIDRIPPEVQDGRPMEDDLSIKEIFGLLATINERVYLPALQQTIADETPAFDDVEPSTLIADAEWNAQPIDSILDHIQRTRTAVVDFLQALPASEWRRTATFGDQKRDIYGLAHHITQQDVAHLSAIGYRLHESKLTSRAEDLPK